jgi:two-component system, chemotaxis family, response regulator Rcp1
MSHDRQQERLLEPLLKIRGSALLSDPNLQQLEPTSPLSKEELEQREELRDVARDARACAHQAADHTRHLVQKTEELFQHARARQEREAEQRSLQAAPDSPTPSEPPTCCLSPVEILLIEDNPGDIRPLQELLKEIAIPTHLQAVACGEEALALLRRQGEHRQAPCPQVILLDLYLPGMEGVQVLYALKHDPALREIPVAVFSATEEEKAQLAAAGPVAAYLRKTFTLDTTQYRELLEVIGQPRRNIAKSSEW